MKRSTNRIIAGVAGTAVLAIAGAGVAAAAPSQETSPSSHAVVKTDGPQQTPPRKKQSGDKPVKFFAGPISMRFINQTDGKVCIDAVGTRQDAKGCLEPGVTSRYAVGMAWAGTDIWSDMSYPDGATFKMWAKNPEVGLPEIGFQKRLSWSKGYKPGESASWKFEGHDFTVKRTDDGGYQKFFDITLTK